MTEVKEGIVLDKDGNPLTEQAPSSDPHQRFRDSFRIHFGGNAVKMKSASLPLKIILGSMALVMLVVGAAIIAISVFVFFFRLIFKTLFGIGRR